MDYRDLLAGLFFGGEALVHGSGGSARHMAIPPLLIGLTVVGFGTSTPGLLVSVDAAWRGVPDIALGNIVGSNIANILLVIGLSALVWPIKVMGATLRRDTAVMMAAAPVLVSAFAMGQLGRPAGLVLVAGLAAWLVWAAANPARSRPRTSAKLLQLRRLSRPCGSSAALSRSWGALVGVAGLALVSGSVVGLMKGAVLMVQSLLLA